MPTPWTYACTFALASEPLVTASWLMVEAIELCNVLRSEVVTALANCVTAT